MTQLTANTTFAAVLADNIANLRAELTAAAARRTAYRTTFNELSNLSDRDLADLGLSRSSIKSVALEAAQNV